MFIQTEQMPDTARMKFFPGQDVLPTGMAEFPDEEAAERSPLAGRLFSIDGIDGVILYSDSIMVIKEDGLDWQVLKPAVLGAIMDHYSSGEAFMLDAGPAAAATAAGEDVEVIDEIDDDSRAQIIELLETRIQPAAEQSGGAVRYHSFNNGTLYLELDGSSGSLLPGIENVMSHYVDIVDEVRDHRDAIPKPGLDTPEAAAIKKVLDERINPSIASHGGRISLVDVQDETAYIRLEGGCQGCGMADVTLKQGVESEIIAAAPKITKVLDTTDHAGGANPYYAPGKDGAPA